MKQLVVLILYGLVAGMLGAYFAFSIDGNRKASLVAIGGQIVALAVLWIITRLPETERR